jgi:hypothetical protein
MLKILTLMVFISQTLLLTIDYCEFKTVVDFELRKEENILYIPTITIVKMKFL